MVRALRHQTEETAAKVVAVLAAAVVVLHELTLRQAVAAMAAMAGHWFWSFEHEAICRG